MIRLSELVVARDGIIFLDPLYSIKLSAVLKIFEAVSASGSKLSVGYIAHVILDLLPIYSRESVRFGNSDGKRLVTLIGFRYIAEKKPVCFVVSLNVLDQQHYLYFVPQVIVSGSPEFDRFVLRFAGALRCFELNEKFKPACFIIFEDIHSDIHAIISSWSFRVPVSWQRVDEEPVRRFFELVRDISLWIGHRNNGLNGGSALPT